MELIPAIDLVGGRVVRLLQGDFDRETSYGDDPLATARGWVDAGARRLHVVDLDGARAGRPMQLGVVAAIVRAVGGGVAVQVAGGLRDDHAVENALAVGADRVVLGTALLRDPSMAERLITAHGATGVLAALDVRDGKAVGEGWREGAAGVPVQTALATLIDAGVRIFAVTAIARDGLLEGPDLVLLAGIRAASPDIRLIASGGVGTLSDLRHLADVGADGAIIGRALYEARFDLGEAIAAIS